MHMYLSFSISSVQSQELLSLCADVPRLLRQVDSLTNDKCSFHSCNYIDKL